MSLTAKEVIAAFESLDADEQMQVIAHFAMNSDILQKGFGTGPYPRFGDAGGLPDRRAGIPTGPPPGTSRLSPKTRACPSCGKPL